MTKSFDDYRKELTMPQLLVSANCCRHAFEAGQQSKQAEVDELLKRVDEALECVDRCTWNVALIDLKKILKGEQS